MDGISGDLVFISNMWCDIQKLCYENINIFWFQCQLFEYILVMLLVGHAPEMTEYLFVDVEWWLTFNELTLGWVFFLSLFFCGLEDALLPMADDSTANICLIIMKYNNLTYYCRDFRLQIDEKSRYGNQAAAFCAIKISVVPFSCAFML